MASYQLPTCKIPTLEELKLMAKKEKEERLSQDYIDKCSEVADIPNGWLQVTSIMQTNIVIEMGFTTELEISIALNRLRRANILYPDEMIFKDSIQVKNNYANKGKYIYGNVLPNLEICRIDTIKIHLYNILNKKHMNLLVASSHS